MWTDFFRENPEILALNAVRINLRSPVFLNKFHPLLKLIPMAYSFNSFVFISSLWTHWSIYQLWIMLRPDMGSIPFWQFHSHSIPFGQFHIKFINSKFINSSSIFFLLFLPTTFYHQWVLRILTPSTYLDYLLRIVDFPSWIVMEEIFLN